MTTPSTSYDWIRTLDPELKALDEIPLTGAPSFPWEELSNRIAKAFEREGFAIKSGELAWRTKDHLYEGLGDNPFPLIFAIPSLNGQVCWVMPEQEMAVLETWLLTKESHPISFQDRALSESFYRFLALEALYHISQVNFDKSLAPILTSQTTLPSEDSLCLDLSFSMQGQMVWGRLIIPPAVRRAWTEHYTSKGPSVLTQQLAQTIEVIVHLEAGKTHLSLDQWKAVSTGDLVILDSCTLDPEDLSQGRVMITVNGKAAHRGKIKDGNLKILELPLYQEVNTPMAKNIDDEDEDDLSDLDFTEDEEQLEEEEGAFEDEDFMIEEEEENAEDTSPATASAPPKQESPASKPASASGPITADQIPVALTVEVGRVQMTMDQLLRLEPGNILELNIRPEDGVDLAINGKVVGRGELLRIGEVLGIRVLELGQ